ncbi:MAG: LppX_LprAFG lipoprotein [Thermomicrobiales bacterium]
MPQPLTRRFVLVAGCGSAVGILTACGQSPPAASPVATPSAADLLNLASRRLAETAAVHFVLDVAGQTYVDSARTIRLLGAEGDLLRPDRVRTTFQAEVLGRAISLQLITIGQQSWTTNLLTGEWGPAPFEFAYRPDVLFSTQDGIGPVMGRVNDVALVGNDSVSGRPVYHLRAQVDQSVVGPLTYYTISGSPVSADLWIDRETYDLMRAQLSEPPGPERPDPAVWTLDLSHHGEKIEIEPPVQSEPG